MPKITLVITGLHEVLGQDYGIKELYWEPFGNPLCCRTNNSNNNNNI